MNGYSLSAAYRRTCTWSFENRDEFLRNRHLIPPYERELYDIVYGYEEPSGPAAVAPPPPQAAPSAGLPTVPPSPSAFPGPVSEYYSDWGRINSAIPSVDTTTPPEDPSTSPADLDTSLFLLQPFMPIPPAEVAFGSTTPHAQVLRPSLPAAALGAELLERILSVPTILSVTYIRGQYQGSTNYHYILPPPPEVDPIHLNGGWVPPGRSMLTVSGDVLVGLPRNTWLDVSMQIVWEEVMISLIGEYAMCMNDIGLSAWQWRWVKTEWNMETVSPTTSLKDIIRLFLQTEPARGAPLILSPVLGAYSNQPSLEFEVPVAPAPVRDRAVWVDCYPNLSTEELEMALVDGLNAAGRIPLPYWRPPVNPPMSNGESNIGRGGDGFLDARSNGGPMVESPRTLGYPSPAPFEDIPKAPKRRRTARRRFPSEIVNAARSRPNLPFPAYWVRTGNAFMVVGDTIEECERILNPMGIRCRFVE